MSDNQPHFHFEPKTSQNIPFNKPGDMVNTQKMDPEAYCHAIDPYISALYFPINVTVSYFCCLVL